MRDDIVRFAAVVAVLAAPSPARALICGTFLSPLTVSATAVNFGTYDPLGATADAANGTVSISCNLGIDVLPSMTISLSTGGAGTYAPRRMTGGGLLDYNLYTSGGFGTVWGNGTGGTATQSYSSVLLLGNLNYTVYGRIPAGQFVAAGGYSDTITVTVTY